MAARSRKRREAPHPSRRGGGSRKKFFMELDPPPRLRQCGCCATFSSWRSHPSWPGGVIPSPVDASNIFFSQPRECAIDARQTLFPPEDCETFKESKPDGLSRHRNAQCMDDLRVADTFGLNKILQGLFDGRSIERLNRCQICGKPLEKSRRFRGHAQTLVECGLIIIDLIGRHEERRVIED